MIEKMRDKIFDILLSLSGKAAEEELRKKPAIGFYVDPKCSVCKVEKDLETVNLTGKKSKKRKPKLVRLANPINPTRDAKKDTVISTVFVKCTIINQGQSDLLLVKIYKRRLLSCPVLKRGDRYSFYIKTKARNGLLKVTAQNESNETYDAFYRLIYYQKTNTANINLENDFVKRRKIILLS